MFVRGEGCLDTALRFLWHGTPRPALCSTAPSLCLAPAAEGRCAMGTAWVGQAGALVQPGQHHSRAGGVHAFTRPQRQQHRQYQDWGTPSHEG